MLHIARKLFSTFREKKKETQRSPRWRTVRDEHLKLNPMCFACGTQKSLQVHHVKPFHLHPELELDPRNLITLCMDTNECHLELGHGDSWKYYNQHVVEDSMNYRTSSNDSRKLILENAKKNRLE